MNKDFNRDNSGLYYRKFFIAGFISGSRMGPKRLYLLVIPMKVQKDDGSDDANALLNGVARVRDKVETLKDDVKKWWYRVMLSPHSCPQCEEILRMTGPSTCVCLSGHVVDPTVAFQRSECCGQRLVLRAFHYACRACGRVVPSRFLSDERVYDGEYFREMMQGSRDNRRERIAKMKELLKSTRSDVLELDSFPDVDDVPDLGAELDAFIGSSPVLARTEMVDADVFCMDDYRRAIRAAVGDSSVMFSALPRVVDDGRKDRARRFVTAVFMEHEGELNLTQYGEDILVEKHEIDCEG